jgi:co-chaperonin GroES (HSP10)
VKLNKAGHFSGTTVQTGNLVLFGKYHSGENIDINGEEHIIIKESELLAIVQ